MALLPDRADRRSSHLRPAALFQLFDCLGDFGARDIACSSVRMVRFRFGAAGGLPTGPPTLLLRTSVVAGNEGVVRRLARSREVKLHPPRVSPQVQIPADKLRPLIHPDRSWITDLTANPLQRRHNVLRSVAEPNIKPRTVATERVDNRQYPQLLPRGQLIVHKVHRPNIVRPNRGLAVLTQLSAHPTPRRLLAKL